MNKNEKENSYRHPAPSLCHAVRDAGMTTFAVSKTGRKTINGNTLTCTITYFGSSSYESGELDVYAKWSGSATKMTLTVETVDYYTGETVSFGNGSTSSNSTTSLDKFWHTPAADKISIYACTEVNSGGTNHALYKQLEGTDGY